MKEMRELTKKHFLEQYLNTELRGKSVTTGKFTVRYFDSSNNKFIQIADVFANLYYSDLLTSKYNQSINILREQNLLKFIFKFPLDNGKTTK